MQTTTHYALNKPDGTDNYNVANDNTNMDAIDTQMYNNAQSAAAAQATANAAVPTTDVGVTVASLVSGNVPYSQLGNVPTPPVATTTADGIVKTSGTSGIAITTDDPAYEQITGSKYITAGTGISVTAGTNGQTVANTGVTSVNGGTGAVTGIATTGANTFTGDQEITGTLVLNGTTMSDPIITAMIYG